MSKQYVAIRKTASSWQGRLEPQEIGEYLDSLKPSERTPRKLYERAKNPKNPLHKYLDWNDKSASEKYRIQQIRSIVMYISVETKAGPVREFVNLRAEHSNNYFTSDEIVRDQSLLDQALRQIVEEITFFETKYSKFKAHFKELFRAIEKTKHKWSKKNEKGKRK